MTAERFIPFRKASIVTMCVDEVRAEERESFRAFVDLLASLLHHEFRSRLEVIKDTYHPFNPDSDTRSIVEPGVNGRSSTFLPLASKWAASWNLT